MNKEKEYRAIPQEPLIIESCEECPYETHETGHGEVCAAPKLKQLFRTIDDEPFPKWCPYREKKNRRNARGQRRA